MVFRIIFLLTILTGLGCAPPPPEKTGASRAVPVQLKWRHQAQFAGFYLAKSKGFYADQNLDVRLTPRNPGLSSYQMAQDLNSGKTLFAIMGGDALLTQKSKGQPLVAIAVIFQKSPYAYATLQGSGIKRAQDLKGKKIMVPVDGRTQHLTLLKKLKIPEDTIEYLPYEKDSDLLATGKIDALLVYRTGSGVRLEEAGVKLNFIWMDDYGIRVYADTLVTTEKTIQDNPALVLNFLKASLRGWQFAIENPDEAAKITLTYDPGLLHDLQLKVMQIQTPLIHTGENPMGWMQASVWKEMQILLKIPEENLDSSRAHTMKFLHEIYPKKTGEQNQ